MECCVLGATQNQNESFNVTIWNYCLKDELFSSDIVEIAVNLAVINFNSGQESLTGLFQRLDLSCGPTTMKYLHSKDEDRVWIADYKARELVKKRRKIRLDRVVIEEEQAEAEWVMYSPGGF